jgi:hypothetical protein
MVPGSITGNLLASSVTFNSNITILGNLTVANSYTQLNSINTYINDPVVVFNNNYTGSLTNYDIGILVNRNLASLSNYGSVNAFLGWSESAQAFIAIATTETGTNVSAINNSGYANVSIGNLVAVAGSFSGAITAPAATITTVNSTNGNVTTLYSTNFSSGNAQITGGNISGEFNVSGTTGQFTNFSAGNARIASGYADNFAIGANTAATGAFTTLSTNGNATIVGNIAITGNIVPSANVTYSLGTSANRFKDLWLSGSTMYLGGFTLGEEASGNVNFTSANGNRLTIVGTTANTVQATGNIITPYVLGSIVGPTATITTSASITGTGASTSTTTGALVVDGGAGIAGNVNIGQLTSLHNIRGNLLIGQGSVQDSADSALTINLNTDTPLVSNATVHMSGASGKYATYGADSFGAAVISQFIGRRARGTSTTPTAVQALDPIASFHGRGYGATGYTTSTASIGPGMTIYAAENHTDSAQGTGINLTYIPIGATSGTVGIKIDPVAGGGGNVVIPATTTSTSTTTGALVVGGGIAAGANSTFGANLTVNGNAIIQGGLVVNGTFEYINSTITTHVDPVLELNTGVNGAPLAADNLADVGLKMHYYNGADRISFIGRAYDTGFLEYYALGTESGNTFSGTYGTVKSGALYLANTSTATGFTPSNAGALYVAGGAGIAGDLYVAKEVRGGNGYFASINNTPIGNATPSTGAFTTLTAITSSPTNLNATFGNITTLYAQNFSSGNIQVTGGYLSGITNFNGTTGTLTNFASGNAVITGGSVNGSPIGASSASTGAFTTVTVSGTAIVSGNIVAGSGTASTNTTTGALVVTGGAGVSGNVTIGGDTVITGDAYVQGGDIWTSATTFNLVNATATTVNFAGAATTLNTGNASGTTNMAGVVKASGNIVAASGTASTNTTTGALVVTGGAGISGAVNIGGNATIANATTFNSAQAAGMDTVIKGVNDATLFWARPNATYDSIIIGNSATAGTAVRGAKLNINTTDSIILPSGTNAQRPGSTGGTDTQGMFRYNTTVQGVEWYTGTQWVAATTSFTVIADSQFTGTGSQTAFTLPTAQTTASCIVSINGVVQIPTLAYSVSTTTLTFTEAPASTDIIDVRMLTTTATVTQISSINGYMQLLVDNNGAYVYTGSVGTSVTTYWDTAGAEVNSRANVTTSTTGNTTIDSFSPTVYSSAEYLITSTISGTNIRELTKILVVTDGTNAYRTVYGVTGTAGNTLTTWSANVYSGSVTLWGASTNANTIYRVKKDYQAI